MPALFTRTFNLLLTGQFLQNMAFASLPLVPLFLAHLEASRTDIGIVMAVGGVGGVLLRPLVGWALDHVGRRFVLVAATVLTALTVAWLGVFQEMGPWLYVNRFLFGIGMGAAATAWFTVAADTVPLSRRTEGIALFGVAGLAGLMVNPLAGELGIGGDALARVFPLVALVILLSLVPLAMIRRERGVTRSMPARGGAPPEVERPGLLAALRAPSLWPVWWITVLFAAIFAAFLFFGTVAAEARGVARPTHLWFTYAAGAIAVRLVGARLPDRIGPQRLILPALALYTVGLLVVAEAQSMEGFLLAGLLAGVGHGYFFPCAATLVLARMPDSMRGSALATFTALLELASLLAAPLFGFLADGWGDALMFRVAAGMCALGVGVWWVLERRVGPTK